MPAVSLSPIFNGWQGFTVGGIPLAGGKLYTYLAGTATPHASYTTIVGNVANSNPIILGSDGRPALEIWLEDGIAYKFVLTDALGLNSLTYDNISGVGDDTNLLALLASTVGAGLIGTADAGSYFAATTVEATLQELGNPNGKFPTGGRNVLWYINPSKWATILNGTSTDDHYAEIQAALTAEPHLVFPSGIGGAIARFNTSAKLIPRTEAPIVRGVSRRGCRINGTHAGAIFEFAINTFDSYFEFLYFTGANCTGHTVASTAGGLQGYLLRPRFFECDWAYELTYGINADLIYAVIGQFTFGYYGTVGSAPSAGSGTMCAIRSYVYPATTNYSNINELRDGKINSCGNAGGSIIAVDINAGDGWTFHNVDISVGGVALKMRDLELVKFTGTCWFESNNATSALIDIGSCNTPVNVDACEFASNSCDRLFGIATSVTRGLNIRGNRIILSGQYVLYDSDTTLRTLPGNGSVGFSGNSVTGGNASNKLVTGLNFLGGTNTSRFWAIVNTAGAGTLAATSDPGATINRTGTGAVTITWSNPYCTSASFACVIASAQGGETRVGAAATTTTNVACFTSAGVAQDDVFHVHVFGK